MHNNAVMANSAFQTVTDCCHPSGSLTIIGQYIDSKQAGIQTNYDFTHIQIPGMLPGLQ